MSGHLLSLTCPPGWAAAGPAQPLYRFDTPAEQTWSNAHCALLNLGRVLLLDSRAAEALAIYKCACDHWPIQ
jgi:hypothetical protein